MSGGAVVAGALLSVMGRWWRSFAAGGAFIGSPM